MRVPSVADELFGLLFGSNSYDVSGSGNYGQEILEVSVRLDRRNLSGNGRFVVNPGESGLNIPVVPAVYPSLPKLPENLCLYPGDRNSQVSDLQRTLAHLGYYQGGITGTYDAQTENAVIQFQQANGLVPDGIAGPRTLSTLNQQTAQHATQPAIQAASLRQPRTLPATSSLSPAPVSETSVGQNTLYIGDEGTAVSQLQLALKQTGYYSGQVTGYYGNLTANAVRRLQQDEGLAANGITGRSTLEALRLRLI